MHSVQRKWGIKMNDREFNELYIHMGELYPDRILLKSDFEMAESKDYKKECTIYYHAHHVLDLEYNYKGQIEELEKKKQLSLSKIREAYKNEISNQAIDHAFDFENVLKELFGSNYEEE